MSAQASSFIPRPLSPTSAAELFTAEQVNATARAIVTVSNGANELNRLQRVVVDALFHALIDRSVDLDGLEPISPEELADALGSCDQRLRHDVIHMMELVEILYSSNGSDRVDLAGIDRLRDFAVALDADPELLDDCRNRLAAARHLVSGDVDRSAYITGLHLPAVNGEAVDSVVAWTQPVTDGRLAQRWNALAELEEGTLGRGIVDFYRARGFEFPGDPGSVPPLLAQHHWVHVIADYGTLLEGEIEIFGFIAAASANPAAFTLLVMVLELFQTGELSGAAGIFEADPGHLDAAGVPDRLADALRRGRLCGEPVDFLEVDFFALADRSVEEVRNHFGVPPKSERARASGSVGPFEPGGISPFQWNAGQQQAVDRGVDYDSHGASTPQETGSQSGWESAAGVRRL
jgi:hypothetical protein